MSYTTEIQHYQMREQVAKEANDRMRAELSCREQDLEAYAKNLNAEVLKNYDLQARVEALLAAGNAMKCQLLTNESELVATHEKATAWDAAAK